MESAARPSRGNVEDLLAQVNRVDGAAAIGTRYELWVPDALTWRGGPVRQDIAMALILDALLAKSFHPDGMVPGTGGRLYRYVREA